MYKILIRPLTIEDSQISYVWRNDKDIWKYTGSRPDIHITPEIEKQWVKKILQERNSQRFAILCDNIYIGNVQLTDIDNDNAQIHIFIGNENYHGKGISSRAIYQLLYYAKHNLKLKEIYLYVHPENIAAIKTYKKNGFIENGVKDGFIKMSLLLKNLKQPIVSVFVMVYNHEWYIRDCIDGILIQKTNFDVEIVVGEDCSTDNSRKILLEYQAIYPAKFKLLLHEQNIGASENQKDIFMNCTGKYIAMCEGDDCWTDSTKLQKQVDFLEAHEDVSMCFHNATIIDLKGNIIGDHRRYNKDQYAPIKDIILGGGGFCATSSIVFRTQYIKSGYPDFCLKCHVGDYPLQLYLSFKGKIYYLNNTMSVYRYGITNSWSQTFQKNVFSLKMDKWISEFELLDGINSLFGFKYSSVIAKRQGRFFIKAILLPNKNMKSEIKKVFELYISKFHLEEKIEIFLIYYAFFLYHFITKIFFYIRLSYKLPYNLWHYLFIKK